jgi:hypothetical protein
MSVRIIAILNIVGPNHLSLIEHSNPEPYAALSYCWGHRRQITTATSNLQQHKAILRFEDLPATVKDAITVVSELGIRRLQDQLPVHPLGRRLG